MATPNQPAWFNNLPTAPGPDLEREGKQATIASSQQSAASSAASAQRERAEFILKHGIAPEDGAPRGAAPGNTNLTGEEYLATVDPDLARQARMYIEGRRAFPTGAALRNPRTQLAIDVAMQADPTLDEANARTRVATRKDFTSGMMARNLTALNTAIGHLKSLQAVGDKLNNTWSPDINWAINTLQSKRLGDPRVNNFNTTVQAFATELAKVFKGTGAPSLTELEDWKKSADPNMSPDQIRGFVHTAAELLQSRIDAMGDAYARGMGKSSDPMTLLNPKAAAAFQSIYNEVPEKGPTRATPFEDAPEGMQVAGQDVRGYRLKPEQEAALDAYLRSDKFTPEGYADMAGAYFKEQTGAEPDQATRAGILSGAEQTHKYYLQNPSAPPVGFDYSGVDKAATENAGLGASVAQAVYNSPESMYNLAAGLVSPVTDLVGSVAAGERQGVYEAVPNMVGDVFGADTGTLDALGSALGERYGSGAGAKRSMIRDPLGVMADVSIPLTLGGATAARAPGAFGRFGRGVATVGRAIDPLSGAVALGTEVLPTLSRKYMPAGASNLSKDVLAELAALPSGVGGKTLREAYAAGKSKPIGKPDTPQSTAFTANMRDATANIGNAVDLAREAVENLRSAASQRYVAEMQKFGAKPVPLSPADLIKTVQDAKPKNYDTMLDAPHRPSDHVAWQQMNDTVQHYLSKATQDPGLLEPLAVDQFKQDLYTIGSKIGGATDRDAARLAGGPYRAVRKMLIDHDPIYARTMKDYGDAAQEAASLESGFSLSSARGKPVNTDAASRKLQSILRNNANTNYGQRAAQGERLAQLDPSGTIMPTLAGQSASSWTPRGLRGSVGAAGLLTEALRAAGPMALVNPKTLAMLAPTSPRIVSEAAYGAGRLMGSGQRLAQPLTGAVDNLSALYDKYPSAALITSRGSQYADETDPDLLRERYGLGVADF
jgi:hypothetical protein